MSSEWNSPETQTIKLDAYRIETIRRQVNLQAEDPNLRYELGLILARSGAHDEAIAEFQYARASASPELKIKAIYQAGLSLEADKPPQSTCPEFGGSSREVISLGRSNCSARRLGREGRRTEGPIGRLRRSVEVR